MHFFLLPRLPLSISRRLAKQKDLESASNRKPRHPPPPRAGSRKRRCPKRRSSPRARLDRGARARPAAPPSRARSGAASSRRRARRPRRRPRVGPPRAPRPGRSESTAAFDRPALSPVSVSAPLSREDSAPWREAPMRASTRARADREPVLGFAGAFRESHRPRRAAQAKAHGSPVHAPSKASTP